MIHNGIEYGMMMAYAEGFDIMRHAGSNSLQETYRYNFELKEIAEVWRRGSVIESWLLDLTATSLAEDLIYPVTQAMLTTMEKGAGP
jgi:6-phosphogluconate dehydrogenase